MGVLFVLGLISLPLVSVPPVPPGRHPGLHPAAGAHAAQHPDVPPGGTDGPHHQQDQGAREQVGHGSRDQGQPHRGAAEGKLSWMIIFVANQSYLFL